MNFDLKTVSNISSAQVQLNWRDVLHDVEQACLTADRDPSSVNIVGVTKYVDSHVANFLVEAGCSHVGESRPQLLWQKHADFQVLAGKAEVQKLQWHLIGHLQRNKVARTVPLLDFLHSIDSKRLASAVDEIAQTRTQPLKCFIEVNISGEPAKTGVQPLELRGLFEHCQQLPGLQVVGLMGMASNSDDEAKTRSQFTLLRDLLREMQSALPNGTSETFKELSMGMSNDFSIAIQCGATFVRIGSRLFA